jgi:hypothetical protein
MTNGEMWVDYSGKSRAELVAIASQRGFDLGEELARAMLRSGTPTPNRLGPRDFPAWRHDLERCNCGACVHLRQPGAVSTLAN